MRSADTYPRTRDIGVYPPGTLCKECPNPVRAKGLCAGHWTKARRASKVAPVCKGDGCENVAIANGVCSTHIQRLKRNGTMSTTDFKGRTPGQRFWNKVRVTDTCWEWIGYVSTTGYGNFTLVSGGSPAPAHRWSYEFCVSTIPDGLHIDHLCYNKRCVNPDHLEPVTMQENLRRAREHYKALRQ